MPSGRHEPTAPGQVAAQLTLRAALPADLDRLARMNRELIQDEGHRNPMTVPELKARLERFIAREGWSVDVFLLGPEPAGYATYRYEPDESEPSGRRVHLRQFYIARGRRRGGIGRRALELLTATRLKPGDRILLEVLETNPGAKLFWSRMGFVPYATTLEHRVGAQPTVML